MILQALTAYYEQLLQQGRLSPPGWDNNCKVSYQLRINLDGEILDLVDCREKVMRGKKAVLAPLELSVPSRVKRTVGISANFLCDNAAYMLGITADRKDAKAVARAAECYKDCARIHHEILDGIDSPIARAILAYYDRWIPADTYDNKILIPHWKDLTGNSNIILCIEDTSGSLLATDDNAIRNAWQRHYNDAGERDGNMQCLITGKASAPELVHPAIKGVRGAQSAGAALVSFNGPAFCSYGHEQGANAPISRYGAYAYTTALNTLLADHDHCKYIGDTALICWAENAAPSYASLGMMGMFGATQESGITDNDVGKALALIAQGKPCDFMQEHLQPNQRFYVLGISPNAARLSVRFFLQNSFGEFAAHLQQHNKRLQMIRPSYDEREILPVWALTRETVNLKARDPSPTPQLAGDLIRAVLTGGRYPATLLNGVNLRIRAEHEVTRGRAAIIKAYYLRNTVNNQTLIPKEVLTMELNEQSTYLPYVLGRLFAVLEGIQGAANPGINTTIKDRYFNAACATPAIAFPTLVSLSQKHLAKLNEAQQVYYSKQLTTLFGKITQEYPTHMSLPEQGAFQIGYYHETQRRYAKKED